MEKEKKGSRIRYWLCKAMLLIFMLSAYSTYATGQTQKGRI